MKNEWPHLLADLRAKRDALTQAIDVIEKHFTIPEDGGGVLVEIEQPRRTPRRKIKGGKKASKRNERTNERTSKARANRDAPAEPP